MREARPHRRGREDGYILVAVLGVMLLLTGIAAAASVALRSSLRSVHVADEDVALAGLAQSGLELAAYQLFVAKVPPAAASRRPIRLAGATLVPTIRDEAAKVDLNGSDPRLLAGLFRAAGMDDASAREAIAAIVARRGDPSPGAPGQPARKAQRGFLAVDEIADLPGMTRADARALTPLLTVDNPDGLVDILTAPEPVLAAIPDLTPPRIAEITNRRADADPETAKGLLGLLGSSASYAKTVPGPAFTARIAVATPDGRHAQIEAVIAASKSPSAPYYVLDWRD